MWKKGTRRRNRFNRKKSYAYLFLLLLCVSIGLGYATIKTDLKIFGIAKFQDTRWDVHFENVEVKEGSVTPTTGAVISNDTTVSFSAQLENPGDYYEFTVDVVNDGTLDAMIDSFSILPVLTAEQQEYFDYIVTYEDGTSLAANQKLEAGGRETLRVAFIYKELQDESLYPLEDQNITISVTINYVQEDDEAIDVAHPPTLYNVLKKAAKVGTYAAKYTGEHQDSFTGDGDKEIYHWYGSSDTNGAAIQNMNNVIFAGYCWQMIRTTDTGGVKMIYNGEAENNQCLNTRGNHVGYDSRTTQNLASSYYYGTDYTYDSTNNVFSLSGILEQSTWNETTAPTLIGKYTCKETTESGTCGILYLVESYNNTTSAYVISLNSNSHYSQFGKLRYNADYKSLAYVGYMYNIVYPVTSKRNSFTVSSASAWTIDTGYYYSDTIDWNTSNANQYTLINPIQLSTLAGDYSSLVGKYFLNASGTNSARARYVTAVDSNKLYYKELSDGDLNTSLTIGDSYTESGGVYTLSGNVTNVPYITWYNTSDFSIYKGKYVCDGNNTSCTNLKHIRTDSNPTKYNYYYFDTTTNYSYAEDVSYDGTTYTLTGDIKTFWDLYDSTNQEYLSTHHYTCLENGISCTTVGYVDYLDNTLYYVQLSGVTDVDAALNNMLYASDVNTKNSTIKTAVDAWYAKYLSSYDSYIEDTIFCNDRTIRSLGAWKPDGGEITGSSSYLQFQEDIVTKDLSCDRVTDQFSTLNASAQLTYKVGLMSSPEMNLLNNNNARVTGESYWLASPSYFNGNSAVLCNMYSSGALNGSTVNNMYGVRPAVSLNPGITYTMGDGSMESPYKVE